MSDNISTTQNQPPSGCEVVVYYWAVAADAADPLQEQKQRLKNFLAQHNNTVLVEYQDIHANRPKTFTALENAIKAAIQNNAYLIIVQLANLPLYPAAVELLTNRQLNFYCLDKPMVNNESIVPVAQYAQQQQQQHSASIRRGLQRTLAKLGNPNAIQEINKVNRVKIEHAVLFAFLIQPTIEQYQTEGLSQRKMVEALNHNNLTAPEGGKWVLSQLQKVLERIRINKLALACEDELHTLQQQGLTTADAICAQLNQRRLGNIIWDTEVLQQVLHRIKTIQDLTEFYHAVQQSLPMLQDYYLQNMSLHDLTTSINQAQISLPTTLLEEVA